MDAAPSPNPVPAPVPPQPDVVRAWPASAQWVTAFLLGVSTTLLIVHSFTYLRWGARPTTHVSPYRIDLNGAQPAELRQLPGVGPTLAQRIDDHRRQHGPFHSVDELREVQGIGPTVLERLRPHVRVTAPEQTEKPPRPQPRAERRETVRVALPTTTGASSQRKLSKKEENLTELIDINRATREELQRLPGIGPTLSQRILNERAKQPFRSVDELRRVRGIGPKTLERLRPYVTVGGDPQRVARAG